MIRRASLLFLSLAAAFVLALPALPRPAAAAAGDPILSYGVDIVSNYVWRGSDLFVATFAKDGEDDGAFQFTPAVQPSITFYGPGGLSFGIWGSYALTDRDAEGAFPGLKTLDEVDYTLAWDWSNRMGAFSAGLIAYTITDVASQSAANEVYLSWGLPFAASIAPTIVHYADTGSGSTYTSLGISGGDALTWSASLGLGPGIQDLTAGIGYGLGESMSVALNVAVRPDETLHGYAEGADYPTSVAWLTFSWGRDVVE